MSKESPRSPLLSAGLAAIGCVCMAALIAALFFLVIRPDRKPDDGRLRTPLMGWSSWNTYRVHISDSLIMRQADAMVQTGLADAGYRFINVDDGFFGGRDSTGKIFTHPKRFPNGLKPVSDYIHSLGLSAGIYSDAGANTCGTMYDGNVQGIGSGLYGHEKQDADLYFNEWGFDFIKIDYCGAGYDLNLEERERYTTIKNAIDATTKHPVRINICRWAFPGIWAAELADSWRISSDIHNTWASVKMIIAKNAWLATYCSGGHYNDMDMLEIGHGLSNNEEEVHFGMWCMMSSPLMIGCDMTTIPTSSLELLKNTELIALDQDPLGLQAYAVQHKGEGFVFVKDIEQAGGTTRAMALYNPADSLMDFSIDLEKELGLGGEVSLRDLVHHEDCGSFSGVYTESLAPRSVKIYKAVAQSRKETSHYEAEWAYLNLYNDLGKSGKSVSYLPLAQASGQMTVAYLGGSEDNYAELRDVRSYNGGKYLLSISYLLPERSKREKSRALKIEVNGSTAATFNDFSQEETGKLLRRSVEVELRKGLNTIKIGSPLSWAPDIDCIDIYPLK